MCRSEHDGEVQRPSGRYCNLCKRVSRFRSSEPVRSHDRSSGIHRFRHRPRAYRYESCRARGRDHPCPGVSGEISTRTPDSRLRYRQLTTPDCSVILAELDPQRRRRMERRFQTYKVRCRPGRERSGRKDFERIQDDHLRCTVHGNPNHSAGGFPPTAFPAYRPLLPQLQASCCTTANRRLGAGPDPWGSRLGSPCPPQPIWPGDQRF